MKKFLVVSALLMTALGSLAQEAVDYGIELAKIETQLKNEQAAADANRAIELDYLRLAVYTLDAPYQAVAVKRALDGFREIKTESYRTEYAELEALLADYEKYNAELISALSEVQGMYIPADATKTDNKASLLRMPQGGALVAKALKTLTDTQYYKNLYLKRNRHLSIPYLDKAYEIACDMVRKSGGKNSAAPDFSVLISMLRPIGG